MLDISKVTASLAHSIQERFRWTLAGLIVLAAAVACSASATNTPIPQNPEVSVIVVTTDLTLGVNRVAFAIVDRNGLPLRSEEVTFRAVYLPPGETTEEVRDSGTATFRRWPTGAQGIFSTKLEFDTAGIWQLEVDTTTPEGEAVTARGALQVNPESQTPGIGHPAPASVTPRGPDVDDLATITTSANPDPDLYQLSIHQALQADKPLVVVFATPAFCVTAACGPQVAVVSELKERFLGRANFIHVEVVKNPHLVEGGRPSVEFVEAVTQWGLPTEPWTFIVDEDGLVRDKFEAFATLEELADSLEDVLTN